MAIRKFGTSDDQKVSIDEEDKNSLQKESRVVWSDKDIEELQEESSK